jgi:mRNA interferase MazF
VKETSAAPSRGDIWMVNLDPVTGHEQAGIRPALIVSVDELNHGPAELVTMLPITTTERDLASRVRIPNGEGGLWETSYVKCEEVRTVSKNRLVRKLGVLNPKYLLQPMTNVRYFLGL